MNDTTEMRITGYPHQPRRLFVAPHPNSKISRLPHRHQNPSQPLPATSNLAFHTKLSSANLTAQLSTDLVQRAREHVTHPKLHLKAEFGKAPVFEDGRALDYYKDTRVGEAIHASKYKTHAPFPDWLVQDSSKVIRKYWSDQGISGVVAVPSSKSGGLVEDFAKRLAQNLGIPFLDVVCKVRETEPQKNFTNRTQKRKNLKDAFLGRPGAQGNLLVVDDVMDSGVTLEEVGKALKQAGAGRLFAFALAKTRHSDDV